MTLPKLFIFCILNFVSLQGFNQPGSIDKLIVESLDSMKVEGMAYAMFDHAGFWSKGFGYADKQAQCLMTDTTVINFASISKPVTAVGIMMLEQGKKINIDKPVEVYLKSWKLPDTKFDKSKVTIKNILKHRAGLSLISVPFFDVDSTLPDLTKVLDGRNVEGKPVFIKFKPGSTWMYSGGGYTMLELLIENRTGTKFFNYMQSNLFASLAMHQSSFRYSQPGQFCRVKNYDTENRVIRPYYTVAAAAGGLHSTVKDMAVFSKELLKMYSGKSGLLSKKYFDKMIKSTTPVDLNPFGINQKGIQCGLGFFVQNSQDDTVVYHSGGNPGVLAYLIVSLKKQKGLVLVSNSDNARPLILKVLQLWGQLNEISLPYFF